MEQIARRDFFAAHANILWMNGATMEEASFRSNMKIPNVLTPEKIARFWIKAEIKWRWRYADMMCEGFGED